MKNLLKNSYSNTNERSNGCFKSTYSQIPEMQRISEMQKEYAIKEQKLSALNFILKQETTKIFRYA